MKTINDLVFEGDFFLEKYSAAESKE